MPPPQWGYWLMLAVVIVVGVVVPITFAIWSTCDDCRMPWWP